jgi:hypothetical protein
LPSHGKLAASPTEKQKERDSDLPSDARSSNMAMSFLAVTHKLQDAGRHREEFPFWKAGRFPSTVSAI